MDLHTHTQHSFDAFTTPKQLLHACKQRGIHIVAITEHDEVSRIDPAPFTAASISVIPGCEFTSDTGAHIIGLFVDEHLAAGSSRNRIFEHILGQSGLIVIPHPFKPGSGYFQFYPADENLRKVSFMELLNGGWDSTDHMPEIRRIAREFGLRMIASSDSHKLKQVGLCVSKIDLNAGAVGANLKGALSVIRQEDIALLIDDSLLKKDGRKTLAIQRTALYQSALMLVPHWIRRRIKVVQYRLSRQPELRAAQYRRFA